MSASFIDRVAAAANATKPSLAQLRLLVSQQIDLGDHLPTALEILSENPLVETEHYPGDLLKAVLSIDPAYWTSHESEWGEAHNILSSIDFALASVQDARANFLAMK